MHRFTVCGVEMVKCPWFQIHLSVFIWSYQQLCCLGDGCCQLTIVNAWWLRVSWSSWCHSNMKGQLSLSESHFSIKYWDTQLLVVNDTWGIGNPVKCVTYLCRSPSFTRYSTLTRIIFTLSCPEEPWASLKIMWSYLDVV